jgi:glycosyltransferase involved in cell wall biosynthesis
MSLLPVDLSVTVIMIFLNEEKFINDAISSVFAQKGDWELLLVDDGSSDDSSEIARQWADRYPERLRYLEHPGHQNRGMSASRNLGIAHAKGKYISFLDADDVWLPGKLERQRAVLELQPDAALVCAPAQFWYSWTGNAADTRRDFVQKLNVPRDILLRPPSLLILFLGDEWASLCDLLVRREAVEEVGGYEDSFQGMYEDQVFHAKLCLRFPVIVSSEVYYRYRQHAEAHTVFSNGSGWYRPAREIFLNWLDGYLSEAKVNDSRLRKTLRREQWRLRHLLFSKLLRSLRRFPVEVANFLKQRGVARA